MTSITLNKSVTFIKDSNKTAVIFSTNYKNSLNILLELSKIEVYLCWGDFSRRNKWLEKQGFKKESVIFQNDDAPHGACRYVYGRG